MSPEGSEPLVEQNMIAPPAGTTSSAMGTYTEVELSLTCTHMFWKQSACVGDPVIWPDCALMDKPVGRDALQAFGPSPPAAVGWSVTGVPTARAGKAGTEMDSAGKYTNRIPLQVTDPPTESDTVKTGV